MLHAITGSVLRAIRAARLAARYGRLMRLLKLIRLMSFIPCLTNKSGGGEPTMVIISLVIVLESL